MAHETAYTAEAAPQLTALNGMRTADLPHGAAGQGVAPHPAPRRAHAALSTGAVRPRTGPRLLRPVCSRCRAWDFSARPRSRSSSAEPVPGPGSGHGHGNARLEDHFVLVRGDRPDRDGHHQHLLDRKT